MLFYVQEPNMYKRAFKTPSTSRHKHATMRVIDTHHSLRGLPPDEQADEHDDENRRHETSLSRASGVAAAVIVHSGCWRQPRDNRNPMGPTAIDSQRWLPVHQMWVAGLDLSAGVLDERRFLAPREQCGTSVTEPWSPKTNWCADMVSKNGVSPLFLDGASTRTTPPAQPDVSILGAPAIEIPCNPTHQTKPPDEAINATGVLLTLASKEPGENTVATCGLHRLCIAARGPYIFIRRQRFSCASSDTLPRWLLRISTNLARGASSCAKSDFDAMLQLESHAYARIPARLLDTALSGTLITVESISERRFIFVFFSCRPDDQKI